MKHQKAYLIGMALRAILEERGKVGGGVLKDWNILLLSKIKTVFEMVKGIIASQWH